jgi:hypothetical protein
MEWTGMFHTQIVENYSRYSAHLNLFLSPHKSFKVSSLMNFSAAGDITVKYIAKQRCDKHLA